MKVFLVSLVLVAGIWSQSWDAGSDNIEYSFDCRLYYVGQATEKPNVIYKKSVHVSKTENSFYAKFFHQTDNKEGFFTLKDRKGAYYSRSVSPKEMEGWEYQRLFSDKRKTFSNPYVYQIHNYDFFDRGDTLVNGQILKKIELRSTKPHFREKKKLWSNIYLVDTTYVMEPLLQHDTAYEIYKARNNFPKGLVREVHSYDTEGRLGYSEKLKSIEPSKLQVVLPKMEPN